MRFLFLNQTLKSVRQTYNFDFFNQAKEFQIDSRRIKPTKRFHDWLKLYTIQSYKNHKLFDEAKTFRVETIFVLESNFSKSKEKTSDQ